MLVLTLSSIGLPGLNGFVGEFLILLGMFQRGWAEAPADAGRAVPRDRRAGRRRRGAGGVVHALAGTSGCSSARCASRSTTTTQPPVARPLGCAKSLALAPLVVFIVWIGLQPQFFLDRMSPTLDRLDRRHRRAGSRG